MIEELKPKRYEFTSTTWCGGRLEADRDETPDGEFVKLEDVQEAIEAWNRRAAPTGEPVAEGVNAKPSEIDDIQSYWLTADGVSDVFVKKWDAQDFGAQQREAGRRGRDNEFDSMNVANRVLNDRLASMLNSQPVSALTDERAARIMRIDLGDGSWLACSGPLDLWALYNENRYVRMLNKFEAQFVDRAILAASPAKVEPVSDDFADRLAAACIECEVPDSVYESLCLAASPPQPQPEPKK